MQKRKKPVTQSNHLVKIITNASLRPQVENHWAYKDHLHTVPLLFTYQELNSNQHCYTSKSQKSYYYTENNLKIFTVQFSVKREIEWIEWFKIN